MDNHPGTGRARLVIETKEGGPLHCTVAPAPNPKSAAAIEKAFQQGVWEATVNHLYQRL